MMEEEFEEVFEPINLSLLIDYCIEVDDYDLCEDLYEMWDEENE
jgi:hypothetical protein